MNFREAWGVTPLPIRCWLIAAWAAGFVLGAVGVIGDLTGWWDGLGFLTNVLSSLVGFLLGVPIALILLSAISESREANADIIKTKELTRNAWSAFTLSVNRFCEFDILHALDQRSIQVYNAYAGIKLDVNTYVEQQPRGMYDPHYPNNRPLPGRDPTGYVELLKKMQDSAQEIRTLLNDINDLVPMDRDIQLRWSQMRSRWRFLDVEVQRRRFEHGLEWQYNATEVFEDRLSVEVHPLNEFYRHIKGLASTDRLAIGRMMDAPELLEYLAALPEAELLRYVDSDTMSPFRHQIDGPDKFLKVAIDAKQVLSELSATVARLDPAMNA